MFRFAFLVGASAMALAASAAQAVTFSFSGTIQNYVIPTTGFYDVSALGAQGGGGYESVLAQARIPTGGLGGLVSGRFWLRGGTQVSIVVGERGGAEPDNQFGVIGGGGGGTFIFRNLDAPLAIAGGGGGGGDWQFAPGGAGGTSLASTLLPGEGRGGTNPSGYGGGGSGAGWRSGGTSPLGFMSGSSAPSFAGGAAFGSYRVAGAGGFGGGGGANGLAGYLGAGGGGGFTGGDGGYYSGGGGGGSFLSNRALNPVATAGVNSGNGSASILFVGTSVPEPGVWATLLSGFALIGSLMRWRRRRLA